MKILLLDTNLSAAPIYNYLRTQSDEVYVVGNNQNDFLAKAAENYINLDYSNIDQIRSLIDSLKIDYIVPGCNDKSYQVCAKLNSDKEFYGIDPIDVTDTINNKEKFRSFAKANNLNVPQVFLPSEVGEVCTLIVKPVDAYSGRGVTIINKSERTKLPLAIKHAQKFSKTDTCIIEEYVVGQLYSHSAFIANGEIIIDFIIEEHSSANQFVVDTSYVVERFDIDVLKKVRENISVLIKKLNLVDGLIHTQFIKAGKKFWLIEVTRRSPGDLYSELIKFSTGFPYAEFYARPYLNLRNKIGYKKLLHNYVIRHTISCPYNCFFDSIHFKISLKIEKFVPISLAGDTVEKSPYGRIALLFFSVNSMAELKEVLNMTIKRELYSLNDKLKI